MTTIDRAINFDHDKNDFDILYLQSLADEHSRIVNSNIEAYKSRVFKRRIFGLLIVGLLTTYSILYGGADMLALITMIILMVIR